MPKPVVYLWIFSLFFFEMCIAEDIQCTVIHDGEQTRYSVSEFNGTGCLYQWKNDTEFSLATNEARVDNHVVMKSNRTLFTNKCSELIHYTVDCLAEGMRKATCTTNCSGHASSQRQEELDHHGWIAPTVVLLVLLLVLLLMCFLYQRFKNQPFCFGKDFYFTVKTENNMTDVEKRFKLKSNEVVSR